MTIAKPTATHIAALAARLGYHSAVDDADQYAAIIADLLGGYDTVDGIDGEPAAAANRAHRVPDPDEDPNNAWYVKTSVTTATTGPLADRTVALKDSIMLAGVPMMNGSALLEGYTPEFDATVATRVLEAGAEITGKTNCEYFCLSGGSHTGAQGPTHNPHRRGYSAGGSSSGSAVAVATGDVDMALGADQAGSIRVPASYSGIVGLKPTYGLVPYTGIAPLDPMLDHVGPMTTTVADNALLLSVIVGPDGFDPRQQQPRIGDCQGALDDGAHGLRIGVLTEGFGQDGGEPDVDAAVREAAADLGRLGADVVEFSVPMHSVGPALWLPIVMQGMVRTVVHGQGFGIGRNDRYPTALMDHLFAQRHRADELPANIKLCTLLAEYVAERHGQSHYGRAVNGIRRLRAAYDAALRDVDLLVMPTTSQKAQPLPDMDASIARWCARATEMFGNTAAFDVTHHPALSLPCGSGDGLPIGMMIVGRHFDEQCVYRAALAYEQRDNR
ncbi:MAG TPA: amidase [Mycobacteriales bacterium]|jgi:amidase|nr:amidase [Mycobacteriales bacterium]